MLSVSFTGTYVVPKSSQAFEKFCKESEYKDKGYYDNVKDNIIFVANDDYDVDVEIFCALNGIKFNKLPKEELEILAIEKRIKDLDKAKEKIKNNML